MSRIRIRHVTGFSYEGSASLSYNEARMLPASRGGQFVISSQLVVEPHTSVQAFTDYWGTRVAAFEVLSAHRELRITAESLVEVRPRAIPGGAVGWEAIARATKRSVGLLEQVQQTRLTQPHEDIIALAEEYRATGREVIETAEAVLASVRAAVEYRPGRTQARTTASEAWEARSGVSQDLAHIGIGALRAMGVPARYVSGYAHPAPDSPVGETLKADSHAWLEYWDGDWRTWNPSTGDAIDERFIEVGHGRDYADVAPLRGIYAGSDSSELFVSVETTREG